MILTILGVFLAGVAGGFIGLRYFTMGLMGALAMYFYVLLCLGVASPLAASIEEDIVANRILSLVLSYTTLIVVVGIIVTVFGMFLDGFITSRVQGGGNNFAGAFLGLLVGFAFYQIFGVYGFIASLLIVMFAIGSYLYSRSQSRLQDTHRLNRQRQQWLEQQLQGGDINHELGRDFWTGEQPVFPNEWNDNFNGSRDQEIQWENNQADNRRDDNDPRWTGN